MFHLLLAVIYLSFISLGLPDSLLGSAWPSMYGQFQVPVSYAGILSMIISGGTILSSLQSDRLIHILGTGKVTAISVGMTAVALLGFSTSHSFWLLCLWAIPYGLGAGSVDAALNNYVALHYTSRHMSWLHCMWGIGASTGPYIMGYALSAQQGWAMGYRYISLIQIALTAILIITLPLWKLHAKKESGIVSQTPQVLTLKEIFQIPGVKAVVITFFCYCASEQTAGLWASSYLALAKGFPAEAAASYAGLLFIGITVGRALSGFLTMKLNDTQMIRLGQCIAAAGIILFLLPLGKYAALAALLLIGLGFAPIYPCIIHSTPEHFGADKSQAVIGMQMACAYMGNLLMPPLFGLIAAHIHVALFPFFLLALLIFMAATHELLVRISRPLP